VGRKIKVALGQFTSKIGDISYNVAKAEKFIYQAADNGADIICLPELFATGYNLNILSDSIISLSKENYEFIYKRMSKAAKDNYINLIAPFANLDENNNLYNSAFFFNRNGELLETYNKTHSFGLEKNYFTEGKSLKVFDTDIGKVGILICYDVGFPETARTLCLKGAQMIFIPSAWRIQDENAWNLNIPSRALENSLYTFGINRSGHEGDLHLFGRSKACAPSGEVILQMDYDSDEAAVCEIDLDNIEEIRNRNGYLRDRKTELYQI